MRIYALISSFMQYMHIYPLFRMDCTLVKQVHKSIFFSLTVGSLFFYEFLQVAAFFFKRCNFKFIKCSLRLVGQLGPSYKCPSLELYKRCCIWQGFHNIAVSSAKPQVQWEAEVISFGLYIRYNLQAVCVYTVPKQQQSTQLTIWGTQIKNKTSLFQFERSLTVHRKKQLFLDEIFCQEFHYFSQIRSITKTILKTIICL